MTRRFRMPWLALVVILGVAGLMGLVLVTSQTPSRPPLPNPNGYDDFIKASKAIARSADDPSLIDLDHERLRVWVATNAEPLCLLRAGLNRLCAMPVEAALTNANMNQLADMKKLAHLLIAEGRLRELDNQPADAARSYTDLIRFGNEISRGGWLITRLVGIACEALGCRALAQVVPRLGREDVRLELRDLEKIDAGRVTWGEVRENERYFTRRQLRKYWNPLVWVVAWWQNRQALQGTETKHKLIVARERLVAIELALRAYQSERGRPPTRLDDLVTNYLSRVPSDPFTAQPMVYRSQATNWLLYSVGPDGKDDGGAPAGRGSQAKGDVRFDSSW